MHYSLSHICSFFIPSLSVLCSFRWPNPFLSFTLTFLSLRYSASTCLMPLHVYYHIILLYRHQRSSTIPWRHIAAYFSPWLRNRSILTQFIPVYALLCQDSLHTGINRWSDVESWSVVCYRAWQNWPSNTIIGLSTLLIHLTCVVFSSLD